MITTAFVPENGKGNTPKNFSGNMLEKTFTGGMFENESETLASAVVIAQRIKSVNDLGWTQTAKRSGSIRPRHRAWGGEGERAIQNKPNYDETAENCVEKWLGMNEFLECTGGEEGPATDTVFVALAGGKKFVERDVCDAKIKQWTSASSLASSSDSRQNMFDFGRKKSGAGSFDEAAFLKSVKDGRNDLVLGWALFLSVNSFFASAIIFPTNPVAKVMEAFIEDLIQQAGVDILV